MKILYLGGKSYSESMASFFTSQAYKVEYCNDSLEEFPLVLGKYDVIIIAAETQDLFEGKIWYIQTELVNYVKEGGHIVFCAPVIMAYNIYYEIYRTLIPAESYRESSQMYNKQKMVMCENEFPKKHIVNIYKPNHPVCMGIENWPILKEGARGTMYSAFCHNRWKAKPHTDVVLITDDNQPALAFERFGKGATMFFLHDVHEDKGSTLLNWKYNYTFWKNALEYLVKKEFDEERYPSILGESWKAMKCLKKREPFAFRKTGHSAQVAWKEIVKRNDLCIISDNQLTYGADPSGFWKLSKELLGYSLKDSINEIGIGPVKFFPPITFLDSPASLEFFDDGGNLIEFKLDEETSNWLPSMTYSKFISICGNYQVEKSLTIAKDTIVVKLYFTKGKPLKVNLKGICKYFGLLKTIDNGLMAQLENGAFFGLVVNSAMKINHVDEVPIAYEAEIECPNELVIALGVALEPEIALNNIHRAVKNPMEFFNIAEEKWDFYFKQIVPYFHSNDERLNKLYYTGFATYYLNLYDIPYEPWLNPHTCPSKRYFEVQWEQDDLPATLLGKWLNDKTLAERQLMASYDTGVMLNFNSTLESLEKGPLGPYLSELQQYSVAQKDLYLMIQKEDLRKKLITAMTKDESLNDLLIEVDSVTGLYNNYNCLGMDDSPRWDFVKNGCKSDWFTAFETGVLCADFNSTIAYRRLFLAELLEETGDTANSAFYRRKGEELGESIRENLWNENIGFYVDISSTDKKQSDVKTPYGFVPLLLGEPSEERKNKLREHFWSENEFNTPYMMPTVSKDHPSFDPSGYWRGNIWSRTNWFAGTALYSAGMFKETARLTKSYVEVNLKDKIEAREVFNPLTGVKGRCQFFTEGIGPCIDMLLKYVVGFQPRKKGFVINPVALTEDTESFQFGPFDYLEHDVTIQWSPLLKELTVMVGEREYRVPLRPEGTETYIELYN